MTLPPKNVSLVECFNASKENANDEDGKGALHARIQISRLRAELARVKMERDILEKATAYFAKAQR